MSDALIVIATLLFVMVVGFGFAYAVAKMK